MRIIFYLLLAFIFSYLFSNTIYCSGPNDLDPLTNFNEPKLPQSEAADQVRDFSRNLSTAVSATGIAMTISAAAKASTIPGKAATIATGVTTTAAVSTLIDFGGRMMANNIEKSPSSLVGNSRPPSPSDIDPNIKSPLEYIFNFQDLDPEKGVFILTGLLIICSFIFLLAVIFNLLGKQFSNFFENNVTSTVLLKLLRFNKTLSIYFLYYYLIMMVICHVFIVYGFYLLLFYSSHFHISQFTFIT